MRTVSLTSNTLHSFNNISFLPLGEKEFNAEQFSKKVDRNRFEPVTGVWGTLGWADDGKFQLDGKISFSEVGNSRSVGATGKIVDEIKVFNPRIDQDHKLIERFINFDSVKFRLPDTFKLDEIPEMRLTLFLQPDEGAVVYYQHSLKNEFNESDAEIEFILPERTGTHFTNNRDRLDYYFDVIPPKEVEIIDHDSSELKLSNRNIDSSFIIKVLTYKRDEKLPDQLLMEATSKINKNELKEDVNAVLFNQQAGSKKYALLKFDASVNTKDPDKKKSKKKSLGGKFIPVNENEIDIDAKTLLLIHGTFSTTFGTFKNLLARKGRKSDKPSFLQEMIRDKVYEQILAFDHPTISEDAFQNVDRLVNGFLKKTYFGSNRVDVVACSRGCVVAECLAGHPDAKGKIEVRKLILFSAANGVNYFKTGRHISKFLSVFRKTASGPMSKILLALAQFSSDYFLSLPGCQQMTPGNEQLNKVLTLPQNYSNTLYKCAVSDWKFSASRGFILKRGGALLLDRSIALILGREHDWVVGCTSQRMTPVGSLRDKDLDLISMHTRYLDNSYVSIDVHSKIREYFES